MHMVCIHKKFNTNVATLLKQIEMKTGKTIDNTVQVDMQRARIRENTRRLLKQSLQRYSHSGEATAAVTCGLLAPSHLHQPKGQLQFYREIKFLMEL